MDKTVSSFDNNKCFCFVYVHYCERILFRTLKNTASILDTFDKHVSPCISNDKFPMMVWLLCL